MKKILDMKNVIYFSCCILGLIVCFSVGRYVKNIKTCNDISVMSTEKISYSQVSYPDNPYQDIIVNNKVVAKGHGPDCEQRYKQIKQLLSSFDRSISVLDIGAAYGYFSFRIAHDFDSTCVMISDPNLERMSLAKLCELNTSLDNVVCIAKRINAKELKLLSKTEHFDVVLALNVLHHFPKDQWKTAAEAVLSLGDYVVIETPPEGDKTHGREFLGDIIKLIETRKYTVLTKVKRHTSPDKLATMYVVKGENKKLESRGIVDFNSKGYNIHSSVKERFLVSKNCKVEWPHGINLTTFKLLRGVYPTTAMLKDSIAKLKENNYSILPQDLFVQGKDVVSISDCKEGFKSKYFDDKMLKLTCAALDATSVKAVVQNCKNAYVHVAS